MQSNLVLRNDSVNLGRLRPKPEGETALLTIINAMAAVATSAHHGGVQVVAVVALLVMGAMFLVHGERN